MADESKLTLDAIYAAWRAVGADVVGLDWAKFVGHIAAQAPAEVDGLADAQIADMIDEAGRGLACEFISSAPVVGMDAAIKAIRAALESQAQPKLTTFDSWLASERPAGCVADMERGWQAAMAARAQAPAVKAEPVPARELTGEELAACCGGCRSNSAIETWMRRAIKKFCEVNGISHVPVQGSGS